MPHTPVMFIVHQQFPLSLRSLEFCCHLCACSDWWIWRPQIWGKPRSDYTYTTCCMWAHVYNILRIPIGPFCKLSLGRSYNNYRSMAPGKDDTPLWRFGSRKKSTCLPADSQVMSPTLGWLAMEASRSRRRSETADERLDRLIGLELRSRSLRQTEDGRPEIRRLQVEQTAQPSGGGVSSVEDRAGPAEDPVDQLVPLFAELALEARGSETRQPALDGVAQREVARHGPTRLEERGFHGNSLMGPLGAPMVLGPPADGLQRPGQGDWVLRRSDRVQGTDHGVGRGYPAEGSLRDGVQRPAVLDLLPERGDREEARALHLLGELHDPALEGRVTSGPISQGGPVVVPVMGAMGTPEVELLPQERDHGINMATAAVAWTQRQVGSMMRTSDASELVGQGNQAERSDGGQGNREAQGASGGVDMESEMERIRQRCLRDAEAAYQAEVRRLRTEEVASYHTATSGSGEGQCRGENVGEVQTQQGGVPARTLGPLTVSPGVHQAGASQGHQGHQDGRWDDPGRQVMSNPQGHTPPPRGQNSIGPVTPPPGLQEGYGDFHRGDWTGPSGPIGQLPDGIGRVPSGLPIDRGIGAGYNFGETVRGTDLPPLPALGGEQAPLLFGDWLTLATPTMYDLSQGSRIWWDQVLREVEELYAQWLQASPLQRLRLRPQEGTVPAALHRVEMKGVTMLLQVLPETVKRDIVANRTLSSTSILFKLFTLFQPGGGMEKAGLLKHIVEPKIPTNAGDLLGALRQWRRWISRAQELGLTLPDPTILATVLGRMADALSKLGGHQMSFRISAARQELSMDHRPNAGTIRDFAEYLQAEAEELTLMIGAKGNPSTQPVVPSATTPAVKALNYGQGPTDQGESEKKQQRAPCRFWKTDEGCRKGIECTYLHDATDMKGRCFGCGSTNHVKKECPVRKASESNPKPERVKKIQKTRTEKAEKSGKPTSSTSSTATIEKTDVKKETTDGPTAESGDRPEVTKGTPISAADELLKEAADLLKSLKVKSVKAVRIKSFGEGVYGSPGEFALLDGGATNALRKARDEELSHLVPTTVELAHGTTTLFRVPGHQTLLSKTDVEPIIPLGWLVQSGYHIDWGRDRCVIQHPVRGPLQCELRAGCPVMQRSQGLELLHDLETGQAGSLIECQKSVASWWLEEFPLIPQRLLRWTEGQDQPWKSMGALPWNRHKRRRIWKSRGVVLHLFAGRDHKPWEAWQQQGYEVLCLDIQRGGDLHQPAIWAFLWELATSNKLVGIIGGPPCRSVSRLRSRQPGPVPLRGRSEEDRWGLPGLSVSDQAKTDYDSMLLLKQIALWRRAEETRAQRPMTMFLMESPEDPANYLQADESENLPSFWTFPEVLALVEKPEFRLISFDQGTMGHARRKPTSILCNMDVMEELNEMRVSGKTKDPLPQSVEDSVKISESWSKWAPGLVEAIVRAGSMYLNIVAAQPSCRKLDVEGFRRHIQNDHVPYRRDCRQCLETMGQSEPHRRLKLDGAAYCLSVDLAGPFPLGRDEGFNKKTAAKYILVGSVAIPKLDRGLDRPLTEGDSQGKKPDEPLKAEPLPEELQPDPQGEAPEEPDPAHRDQDQPPDQDLLPEGAYDGEEVTEDEVSALNVDWKEKAKELSTTVGLQQVTMVEVLESRNTKDVVPAVGRLYAKMKAYGIPIHRIHSDRERCFITTSFRDFCLNRSLYQTMTSGDTPQENGRVESEICQVKRRLRLMLAESKLPRTNWPSIARWVGEQRCRSQLARLGIPTKPMISPGTKVMVKQKLWNKKQGALSNPYKRMTLLGPSPLMSSGWVVKDGNKVQHAKAVVVEAANSEAARLELEEARPRRLHGKQRRDDDQLRLPAPILSARPEPADPIPALHSDTDFDPGTVIAPEVEYDPESPLPEDDEMPALRVLQAGGGSQPLPFTDRGEYLQCRDCGLLQRGSECGFCSSAMTSRTKVATLAGTLTSELEEEYWNAEVMDSGELIDQLRSEHWEWKRLWNRELAKVAVGAEAAASHGEHLEFLENVLLDFEEELEGYGAAHERDRTCLKALVGDRVETSSPLHPVLQTYTVGLAEVRGNMTEWEGAIRKELTSLFDTTKALRRTTVKELASWPGADQMEQAPVRRLAWSCVAT